MCEKTVSPAFTLVLPAGWIDRGHSEDGQRHFFVSPDGEHFHARRDLMERHGVIFYDTYGWPHHPPFPVVVA
jgi:hypothetical protein